MNAATTTIAPASKHAPSSWQTAGYRACGLCVFGLTDDGRSARSLNAEATRCSCPSVTGGSARSVRVMDARANFGPCGPEALHQDFPGLRR